MTSPILGSEHITAPLGGFEGPEKRLEISFVRNVNNEMGFRTYDEEAWQSRVLTDCRCAILNRIQNDYWDAYLLSESSMFVSPYAIVLKTCGTTTLLRAIPPLLKMAEELGTRLEWLQYSRKNYTYPDAQVFPHGGFEEEIDYLKRTCPPGDGYILGPVTSDHWNVYIIDRQRRAARPPEVVLEVMMHDLDEEKMKLFEKKPGVTARDLTEDTGIIDFLPNSDIDDFLFDPCGYSMNGLRDNAYHTIHITPEPHCSYVSFETNLQSNDYRKLVHSVLDAFLPGRVMLTIFADHNSKAGNIHEIPNYPIPGFSLTNSTRYEIGSDYDVLLCNYKRNDSSTESLTESS